MAINYAVVVAILRRRLLMALEELLLRLTFNGTFISHSPPFLCPALLCSLLFRWHQLNFMAFSPISFYND